MKMYVKMKELGPIGGGVGLACPPLDPPMIGGKNKLVQHSTPLPNS